MNQQKKRNILFIAPVFFGYEKDIINVLKDRGFNVFFVQENVDSTSFLFRCLNKLSTHFRKSVIRKHFITIINSFHNKNIEFEYIIGIRLDQFDEVILNYLKSAYPHSKYICYYWDSTRTMRNSKIVAKYFDKVYTFDKKDAIDNNWIFLPLFYNKQYQNCNSQITQSIDILFVASIMPKRAYLYKLLSNYCNNNGYNLYTYFYCKPYVFIANWLTYRNIPLNIVHGKGLKSKKILELFSKSKIIFDCSNPNQTGLTMRTIECLGARKNDYNKSNNKSI